MFPCQALEAYKVDSTLTCISLSLAFGLEALQKPSWFDLVESLLESSFNAASVLHASSWLCETVCISTKLQPNGLESLGFHTRVPQSALSRRKYKLQLEKDSLSNREDIS